MRIWPELVTLPLMMPLPVINPLLFTPPLVSLMVMPFMTMVPMLLRASVKVPLPIRSPPAWMVKPGVFRFPSRLMMEPPGKFNPPVTVKLPLVAIVRDPPGWKATFELL